MGHGDTSAKATADSPALCGVPLLSRDKTVRNKSSRHHKLVAPAVPEPRIILKVNPESFLTQLNIFVFFIIN